jgi:hypothetical protein
MTLKTTIAAVLVLAATVTAAHAGNNQYLCEFTYKSGDITAMGKVAAPDMAALKGFLAKIPGRGEAKCSKGYYGAQRLFVFANLVDPKPATVTTRQGN